MNYNLSYNKLQISEQTIENLAVHFCMDKNVMRILCGRGMDSKEKLSKYFNSSLNDLHDPFLFEDMHQAVDLIKHHIDKQNTILIYGDYDVDGISATATLVKYFESLNAKVAYFLPNRYEDGYGLTISALEKLIEKHNFKLLITVDCGITAVEEVGFLKSKNIDVVITDHHEVGEHLPDCPIINPKYSKTYPFDELCGSGVAIKLVQALGGTEAIKPLLPITAIATIADIVDLLDENRIIVKYGLEHLDLLPAGIKKLFKKSGLTTNIKASDIAFKVAPKINASGRMGDAETSLLLYLENNLKTLDKLVLQTISYNTQRQELCNKVYNDASKMLNETDIYSTKVIILKSDEWDAGILGIVAARISEEYNRVTFLFSDEKGLLKGSCRSVNNVDVHKLLSDCTDILEKFGGHKMAAGVTLHIDNYNQFCKRTAEYVLLNLQKQDLLPSKFYDIEIPQEEVNIKLLKDIEKMEPCGHNNSRPIFKFLLNNATISPLKNYPEHILLSYDNMSLLSFNSANLYYILSENTQSTILADLYIEEFKGRQKISGIVKSVDYDDIYRPQNSDVLLAEHIKQLTFNNDARYKFLTYSREQFIRLLLQMKKNVYGTLFVAYDYNTYLNFKTIYDFENVIKSRIFEICDHTGFNSIILAPKNFNNFNSFENIVFLDPVLHMGFLSTLSEKTKAKIYLPPKTKFSFSTFAKIDLSRETFAKYFRLFDFILKSHLTAQDSYSLFMLTQKHYPQNNNLDYLQFMVCLYVFTELNIIKISDKNYGIESISKQKNELTNSSFYNRLQLIKLSGG